MKRVLICILIAASVLGGCGESKPSRGQVEDALFNRFAKEVPDASAEDKELFKKWADCVTDEIYDELSAGSLNKLVDAEDSESFDKIEGSKEERDTFDESSRKCAMEQLQTEGSPDDVNS